MAFRDRVRSALQELTEIFCKELWKIMMGTLLFEEQELRNGNQIILAYTSYEIE